MASLKRSKTEVINEIVSDANNRDAEKKPPWVVLMDGALHLWSLILQNMEGIDYVGILDIMHVIEYLWLAGNTLHGEKNLKPIKWVHDNLVKILKGDVDDVIFELQIEIETGKRSKKKNKSLESVWVYFDNHLPWMRYDEYLLTGYPIGTGVVESSCGHTVKDRMEGTGKRWSVDGAEAMLLLRSVYTSGDWDQY